MDKDGEGECDRKEERDLSTGTDTLAAGWGHKKNASHVGAQEPPAGLVCCDSARTGATGGF